MWADTSTQSTPSEILPIVLNLNASLGLLTGTTGVRSHNIVEENYFQILRVDSFFTAIMPTLKS